MFRLSFVQFSEVVTTSAWPSAICLQPCPLIFLSTFNSSNRPQNRTKQTASNGTFNLEATLFRVSNSSSSSIEMAMSLVR